MVARDSCRRCEPGFGLCLSIGDDRIDRRQAPCSRSRGRRSLEFLARTACVGGAAIGAPAGRERGVHGKLRCGFASWDARWHLDAGGLSRVRGRDNRHQREAEGH